jgi:hypothetical protein
MALALLAVIKFDFSIKDQMDKKGRHPSSLKLRRAMRWPTLLPIIFYSTNQPS